MATLRHPFITVSLFLVLFSCLGMGNQVQARGLFAQVLDRPGDPELNFALAEADEAAGNLRHALAAYERILHADPNNARAREAFNRLRLALSPPITSLHVAVGATGHSGLLASPSTNSNKRDGTLAGVFSLIDERSFLRWRWRSDVSGGLRLHREFDELNEFRIGAVSGPLLQLGEGVTLHMAGGGEVRYLDGDLYYSQVTSRFALDFLSRGNRQTITATVASRRRGDIKFFSSDPASPGTKISSHALLLELSGKFSWRNNLRAGDVLFVRPRLRYLNVDGAHRNTIFDDSLLFQDLRELGSRFSYYVPVAQGDIFLGVGFSVYRRNFTSSVSGGTKKRQDIYLEPSAHLVIPGIFGKQSDFRIDYHFKRNDSNDVTYDYDTHALAVKLVRRF